MRLYTIGHGNLDIESFLQILRENHLDWVADVRSAPYSRMFPWFNKTELAQALEDAGMRYVFLGQQLGGKPREGEAAGEWKQGKLNYQLVSSLSRTKRWTEGIKNLIALVKSTDDDGEIGCLLCSERDPNNCHRSLVSFNVESALPELTVTHLGYNSGVREAKFQDALFAVADE